MYVETVNFLFLGRKGQLIDLFLSNKRISKLVSLVRSNLLEGEPNRNKTCEFYEKYEKEFREK